MGRDTPNALATAATDAPESTQSNTLARAASGAGESPPTKRRARRCSEDKNDTTTPKPPHKTSEKCKAPTPKPKPETPPPVTPSPYSRPWFSGLLADALQSNDLAGACARAKVTMLELVRARGADPAIDAAMIEVDELSRLMAVNTIMTAAASGDMKAIKAMTDGTLRVLQEGLTPATPETLSGGTWHRCSYCRKTFRVIAEAQTYNGFRFVQVTSTHETRPVINDNPETDHDHETADPRMGR